MFSQRKQQSGWCYLEVLTNIQERQKKNQDSHKVFLDTGLVGTPYHLICEELQLSKNGRIELNGF